MIYGAVSIPPPAATTVEISSLFFHYFIGTPLLPHFSTSLHCTDLTADWLLTHSPTNWLIHCFTTPSPALQCTEWTELSTAIAGQLILLACHPLGRGWLNITGTVTALLESRGQHKDKWLTALYMHNETLSNGLVPSTFSLNLTVISVPTVKKMVVFYYSQHLCYILILKWKQKAYSI